VCRYLLSSIPLMTVHIPCNPAILRLTNLIFTMIIIPAVISIILESIPAHSKPHSASQPSANKHSISDSPSSYDGKSLYRPDIRSINGTRSFWINLIKPSSEAFTISTFPLIFFFGNLYYTDVASVAGVLGCLALAKKGMFWTSSLVSDGLGSAAVGAVVGLGCGYG
jgi:alpha-1,2-glucosyltransferase